MIVQPSNQGTHVLMFQEGYQLANLYVETNIESLLNYVMMGTNLIVSAVFQTVLALYLLILVLGDLLPQSIFVPQFVGMGLL